jgi:hypothetical protein
MTKVLKLCIVSIFLLLLQLLLEHKGEMLITEFKEEVR